MSRNFFPPNEPIGGRPGEPGDAEIRETYGPREGKAYAKLLASDWIVVEGWKFRFARPVVIRTKKGQGWLGFSLYWESPDYPPIEGPAPLKIAGYFRSMRVYKGRLYPTMMPWTAGKFMNTFQVNKTFARLIYEATKQWGVIKQNPEFGVDGVKNPLNTLAYSLQTVQMAMLPYTPGEKTLKKTKKSKVDAAPEIKENSNHEPE